MKREVAVLLLILFIPTILASIEVKNLDIQTDYLYGSNLQGKITLSVKNEPLDSFVSLNAQKVTLKELLDDNNINYSCDIKNCKISYKTKDSGQDSVKINLQNSAQKTVGFKLKSKEIELKKISFDISSTFKEQEKIPLKINFFEKNKWNFTKMSNSFGPRYWGCFNPNSNKKSQKKILYTDYCENLWIEQSRKIAIGADINGKDKKNLSLYLYKFPLEESNLQAGPLEFAPGKEVVIEKEKFEKGKYIACIGASGETNYSITYEKEEPTCGLIKAHPDKKSTTDYGIYLREAKFASAKKLNSKDFDFQKILEYAKEYLKENYKNNCSASCILPMTFSGIPQEIELKNLKIGYTGPEGGEEETKIYSLEKISPKVTFNATIDLSLAGFKILKEGKYELKINSKQIFQKDFTIYLPMNIIGIYPTTIPQGMPSKIYLITKGSPLQDTRFVWTIENKTMQTELPMITYTPQNFQDQIIAVSIKSGNKTITSSNFQIKVISPQQYINQTLETKEKALSTIKSHIAKSPKWYQSYFSQKINLSGMENQIALIKDLQQTAKSSKDYIQIINQIQNLSIPDKFKLEKKINQDPLDKNSINPLVMFKFEKLSPKNEQSYKEAVYKWEKENNNAILVSNTYLNQLSGNITKKVLAIYSLRIRQWNPAQQFLVIKSRKENIVFKNPKEIKQIGEYSVIPLKSTNEEFQFFLKNNDPLEFFISPKLSTLIINSFNEYCNHNSICEKELGENHKSCPSDCKSTLSLVFLILLVLSIAVALYTIIQQWYKRNYEKHLFQNAKHLYNLLMFIENARIQGLSDAQIKNELKKQGWDSERISYVMKKSIGKTPGLPEIIPIEKIKAWMRRRKARKRIITPPQQQFSRNFNKYPFQNR